MSTVNEPTGQAWAPQAPYPAGYAQPQYAPAPQYYGQPAYGQQIAYPEPQPQAPVYRLGPVGKIRSTWAVIGLCIITLGIYALYYQFATHEEMKRHTGHGVGGLLGLLIALFTCGVLTSFLLPHEVGNLYAAQRRHRPVTATTGLWVLLGSFILIGPLVWLIKTNGALNAYWRSMGAR